MSTATATKMGLRPSDYLISPRDLAGWARGLGRRDALGLALVLVAGAAVALWLQDLGAGLFAAGLVLALWWHVDSRWSFGAALVLLVLIPLMQFLYDRNWLYTGAALAGGMAVAVWYLLAIGVVRAVAELRTAPEAVTAPAPATAPPSRPEHTASRNVSSTNTFQPIVKDPTVRAPARHRQPISGPATSPPANVPSWRRRLAAIEGETRRPTGRRSLDGLRGRRP